MRKVFLAIAGCLLMIQFANAQNLHFKKLANMKQPRGAVAYAADSNFIYVSNGYSANAAYTTEIERYDVKKNKWSVLAYSLVPKRFSSSVIVNNNLYLFNGLGPGNKTNNKTEVINLSTGAVSYSTDNPFPTSGGGAAAWNGLIYVFGGSYKSALGQTAYSNKLYCFNPATKVWTKLANMPGNGMETKGEIVNGALFVLGGFNGAVSNAIYKYDIASDTWTNAATMPEGVSSHALAADGSKIYIVGDYSNLMHLACYDIKTNTYTNLEQTNMIGRRGAAANIVDGKLYIMGGNQTESIKSSLQSVQVAAF